MSSVHSETTVADILGKLPTAEEVRERLKLVEDL